MKLLSIGWNESWQNYKKRILRGEFMFRRIRDYFALQRNIQIETLETLCTICLWLEHNGRYDRNPYSKYMNDHFATLKALSKALRSK